MEKELEARIQDGGPSNTQGEDSRVSLSTSEEQKHDEQHHSG